MNDVFNKLNELATIIPWTDVLEFLAISGILSLVLVPVYKLVKRWFEHNKGVMRVIVTISGLGIAFGQYMIETQPQSPAVVAYSGLAIAFTSQTFWHVAKACVAILMREVAKAQAFDVDVKSAALPTGVQDIKTSLPGAEFDH